MCPYENSEAGDGSSQKHPVLTIERYPSLGKFGTFGKAYFLGSTWYSLEREWKDNRPNVSSIPYGEYKATFTWSDRFKRKRWRLEGVKGRDGILIHPANIAKELRGCIALGKDIGCYKGEWAILRSKEAIREFHSLAKEYEYIVVRIIPYGGGNSTTI